MKSHGRLGQLAAGRVRAFYKPDRRPSLGKSTDLSTSVPFNWAIRWANEWQKNTLIVDSAVIMSQLLQGSPDGKFYYIGGMYIEFSNGAYSPPGSVNPLNGISYYNNLFSASGGTRDYLRVGLTATSDDNSDDSKYRGNNIASFIAQTAEGQGVHGLTLSTGHIIYGGGLVAYPDESDSSQDLIFARFFFSVPNQVTKVAGSQVGITWEYTFTE